VEKKVNRIVKNIMIQGTGSSVGKSVIATALCRIFSDSGFSVAPFKSQNMAPNSYVTKTGLEMGMAQAVQAEAARAEPEAAMNPILLKPVSDRNSQFIVMGKAIGNMSASEYYKYKPRLIDTVKEAYRMLSERFDAIVIEGAGSPAEINLIENDIVNMGMAHIADAPVLLVGDIDRGGVFAALAGTMLLLPEDSRERVKGVIINKFRGDIEILKPGLAMLEEIIKRPVLGVVPYTKLNIEEEDSLTDRKPAAGNESSAASGSRTTAARFTEFMEAEYNRLANIVRESVDIQAIKRIMGL
jgi:adenosylcobyric acid synthase